MNFQSVADIAGPWNDTEWDSGLVERCRKSWNIPINELSNEMLATFLRQQIATDLILEEATRRLTAGFDDGSEVDKVELKVAVETARERGTATHGETKK
jgi:hypothetical protein